MPYDPARHHRRSIRLRGYDYTQPGAYFITICTYARRDLFDSPAFRQIAEQQWRSLARAGERGMCGGRIALDAWVVMPDHLHGIIVIDTPMPQENAAGSDIDGPGTRNGLGINVAPGSLGALVRSYKAAVARRINALRRAPGAAVWQRGYYERVVRDEEALERVRRYIAANPARHAQGRDDVAGLLARMQKRR